VSFYCKTGSDSGREDDSCTGTLTKRGPSNDSEAGESKGNVIIKSNSEDKDEINNAEDDNDSNILEKTSNGEATKTDMWGIDISWIDQEEDFEHLEVRFLVSPLCCN
jgi:hypothetical protein